MENRQNLFAEFDGVSKATWLENIEKGLKEGTSLADLQWQLGTELTIDPFGHQEDWNQAATEYPTKSDNNWGIGEAYTISNATKSNQAALEGLLNGVEAPHFIIDQAIDLDQLLKGIDCSMIATHFSGQWINDDPVAFLKAFYEQSQKGKGKMIKGSLGLNGLDLAAKTIQTLIAFQAKHLPDFVLFNIPMQSFYGGQEKVIDELSQALRLASDTLYRLVQSGVSVDSANQLIHFSVAIGPSYFVEIAKIRALKNLWLNVLKAYKSTELSLPVITAHLAPQSQTDDQYTNMIRANTQAMSAVIAGVDYLYILPANAHENQGDAFTRRIARNVQHILKMESFMDRVVDPAAGSYYIEKLSDTLARKAWDRFQVQ